MRKSVPTELHIGMTFLSSCFLFGAILGFVLSGFLNQQEQSNLCHFFQNYFSIIQQEDYPKPPLLHTVWANLKTPLYIFLLGFSLLGTIGIPFLLMSKGFVFAFSVSALCRLLGLQGIVPAFFLFCLPAFLWVPVLFALSLQSFRAALRLWGRGKRDETYPSGYFLQASIPFLGVIASISIDYFILPLLVQAIIPFTTS